ncbi:M14 family zinc carboxypeptidase [Clostridium algidicarnis]|uniref:Putative deacylase n=1 Tax=Clostridium algidicarnis DSM 15099 TaxID=1121295 RepID=A0A2S6FUI2_9CLOT|nr:M14 family zinc carboxypeptidase [Clostridium algidicarnis]PPK43900.1 putative deacylase [Clostridium algidicarnis DSM 15099]
MGKYYPNVNPGEIVQGGFTYPNNAKLQGDFLYLRDANKNMVSGRQVDNGNRITVLDVGYTKQLALVQYPTSAGVRQGYVKYEGVSGFTDSNIKIPPISHPQAIKEEYGISGKGRPLNVYKIGNGSKVLFAGFAIHGWEDNWDNDGLALVDIANSLITRLGDYKSQNNGLHGWTVYIAPCMNPDGVIVRGTKDGPGRCAVTSRIDMNRCFPYNFTPQYSSRNYTGSNSLGAQEAKAIKSYLEKINSSSTEMIVLDFHGWMNFTQGNAEIGRYFGSQFGFGHNNGYSSGFFSSWASTLKNTKAVLIEYPTSTYSYSDVITGNYIGKTFNGIVNILKNNPGSSGEWIKKGDRWYYGVYELIKILIKI